MTINMNVKTSPKEQSEETSDKEQSEETSDKKQSEETSDKEQSEETSDKEQSEETSDKEQSEETSDKEQSEETSDKEQSEETSDKEQSEETSDKKQSEETSDKEQSEETSDKEQSEETSDKEQSEETSDKEQSEETSDKEQSEETSDKEQSEETSDKEQSEETSDKKQSEETSDKEQSEETSDKEQSEETSDKEQSEETSDKEQSEETSDKEQSEETSDKKQSEETSDKEQSEETSDKEQSEETSDKEQSEETSDKEQSEETSGKKQNKEDIRRQLLRDRISNSSPDIIFCQELPGCFKKVAEGNDLASNGNEAAVEEVAQYHYEWVRNGNEAGVMWKPGRFDGPVNEAPGPTEDQRKERNNTTLDAIEEARNLLSKISMVKLARKKSGVSTLAVSYDGRSIESEKLRHDVFSILVEFLKKVIAENGIDFCIIGGDIGLDTVELPTGVKILSYESDKENDHPCMDCYILPGPGVKCVQNIKAVHFESRETPREHDQPNSSVRQNSTEPATFVKKELHCQVVEEFVLSVSQFSNRRSSNACTIIAVLAAINFLSGEGWFSRDSLALTLEDPGFPDYCRDLFNEGNKLYDELGENINYSTLDILKHFKDITETKGMYDKSHNNFQDFLKYLSGLSRQVMNKLAFVLIFPVTGPAVSMVLLINERGESMLIDSHKHLGNGAIVATAPKKKLKNMIDYIETMVKRDWGLTVSDVNPFDVTAVVLKKQPKK